MEHSWQRAEAGTAAALLGLALQLNAEWKATPIGHSDSFFYWGSGTVRSIGLESDVLLATLADLYNVSVATGPMRLETRVAVVGLRTTRDCSQTGQLA